MRKAIKIFLSVISTLVLLSVILPVLASILLSSSRFQNYAAGRVTNALSEKLGTTVRLDRIDLRLFNRVVVRGFYVEDLQGDTLLYAGRLAVGFRGYNPRSGVWRLGDVALDSASLNVMQDSTLASNLSRIVQRLKPEKPKENRRPLNLRAASLTLENSRFRMRRYQRRNRPGAVDFSDLDAGDIRVELDRIGVVDDSISVRRIRTIAFREKSGFTSRNLSASRARVSSSGIRLDDFVFEDGFSDVRMTELNLTYPAWRAFRNFTSEVEFHAQLRRAQIAFRTIGRFAPALRDWQSVVELTGTIDGPLSALRGRLDDAVAGRTRIDATYRIEGLPKIKNTRFVLDINDLTSYGEDAALLVADMAGAKTGKAAAVLQRLDELSLGGRFDGTLSDFQTEGELSAAAGTVGFNVRLNPAEEGRTYIDGRVSVGGLDLGRLLAVQGLGGVSAAAVLNGFWGADSVDLKTDALISEAVYNRYRYRDVEVDGIVRNNFFQGFVGSRDPNIDFSLDGTFDFNREVPRYDFAMDLRRADLNALGLNRRDSVSVLSARIDARAEGTRLDDITGGGTIRDLVYRFPGDTLRSKEIRLTGDNQSETKTLTFSSDFADIEMRSRLNVNDIVPSLRQTLRYYLPSLDRNGSEGGAPADSVRGAGGEDYYLLSATVRESGSFAAALLPGLYVAEGTTFSLLLNPETPDFSLILNSEGIEYKNMYASGIRATNRNQGDSIALFLRTNEAGIGNFHLPGLSVQGGVKDNMVALSAGFTNPDNRMSAILNTVSRLSVDTLSGERLWRTRFGTSRISLGDQRWWVASPGITWGDSLIAVDRLRIVNADPEAVGGRQELLLDGRLSAGRNDTLHLSMVNFDLAPLSGIGIVERLGYRVQGRMNGSADLIAGRGDPLFRGNIRFENVRINDHPVQDALFVSAWDPAAERIRLSLTLERGDTVLWGGYRPGDRRYRLNARIPDIDLVHLSPVLGGVLSDISGSADADLVVTGTDRGPSIDGTIGIREFGATVDFTRARYSLTDAKVQMVNNDLILPATPIRDEEDNRGTLTARLNTGHFRALDYDVRVETDKILGLNTTERDNDYFYGKVFAAGSVIIRGNRERVDMDMNLTNTGNSAFFMPLSGSSTASEADFIVFEDPARRSAQQDVPRSRLRQYLRQQRRMNPRRSDLNINMHLNVNPDMEVQLVIDPKIGDIVRGNGTGALTLHIRPREEIFTMSGDYRIDRGSYLFTLMNVLNKRFTIEPGSSIQWTGDPLDALLNITATYRVRASVAELTGERITRRIPVDCKILLSDRLSRPTINFDIEVPTADAETRSIVQSFMNTQELKSQQFVWLLMQNGFYVENGLSTGGNIGTTTTAVTGIEFLTNQLSNWISTERFRVNFGYNPRNSLSSDEVEGMISGELIPDRLLIEGEINYNFGNNAADLRAGNPVAGDFALTYIFNNARNLRARVFTRTIDRWDENLGLQEQGAGLYYRKDFNTWRNLFRRMQRSGALPAPRIEEEESEIKTP